MSWGDRSTLDEIIARKSQQIGQRNHALAYIILDNIDRISGSPCSPSGNWVSLNWLVTVIVNFVTTFVIVCDRYRDSAGRPMVNRPLACSLIDQPSSASSYSALRTRDCRFRFVAALDLSGKA